MVRRWWLAALAALAALTLFRLMVAACVPLTPDEAYYRLWALAPAASYFDHPPMVALWIRLGMAVAGDTSLGLRALGPVSTAFGSLLLAHAGALWLHRPDGRPDWIVGARVAVLLNATLAIGLGSIIMTPDTPLIFFVTLLLWSLCWLCAGGPAWLWLVAGLAAGLGFASKYTMVLPVAGVGLWLVGSYAGRAWLRRPWPWLAACVALPCTLPVVWWNAHHAWASFMRQGGRVLDWQPVRALTFLSELLGGQVGLASGLVFILFVGGCTRLWRRSDAFSALLLCTILCPLAVFVQHALGARVQANWPVLVYPACALAAGVWCPRWWKSAVWLGGVLTLVVMVQAVFAPLRLPVRLDVTLRQMGGWSDFIHTVQIRAAEGYSGPAPVLMTENYDLAGEVAFYARGSETVAVEPRWAVFDIPRPACGLQGVLLRPAQEKEAPDPYAFEVLGEASAPVARARRGMVAEWYVMLPVRLRCAPGQAFVRDAASLPVRH
ncbi:MAG: glycosyltransferase family 39 protein [Acetobacter papayae]|uniref:ArnT family glycosyltransferase n=1 Tax=Acetobacter papayae TaxID=1076592 RepID=UPI0039EBFDB7